MPEILEVTNDDMLTPWATTSRIAQDFLAVIVDVLGCTPWGVPLLSKDCTDEMVDEILLALQPSGAIETICCGGVFVSVRRMFWHDGLLNEVRGYQHEQRFEWGVELSAVVLRSMTPMLGGWAGLPLTGGQNPVGQIDEGAMTDQSTILGSDMAALMLAQEVTFDAVNAGDTGAAVADDRGYRVWVPGPVQRFRFGPTCIGNLVGWDRTPPIRANLNLSQIPCADDCIALADRVTPT